MSEQELAAIQARADAATPAPWYPFESPWPDKMHAVTVGYEGGTPICYVGTKQMPNDANRDFIAAARADVVELIAEVRRLRPVVEAGRALFRLTDTGSSDDLHRAWRELGAQLAFAQGRIPLGSDADLGRERSAG